MKNKKLIFGIFLLGIILMSSFALAGITAYVVSGQAVSTDGVTATLKSVSRGGTAIVSVTTSTGATETVQLQEGGTAITSEGDTIQVANLRTGTLFRKPAGEISVVTREERAAAGVAGIGAGATGPQHTHLIDYADTSLSYTNYDNINSGAFSRDSANDAVFVEIPCDPIGAVAISGGFNLVIKDNLLKTDRLPAITDFMRGTDYFAISFIDPDEVINIDQSLAFVYCAQIELADFATTAHFPY